MIEALYYAAAAVIALGGAVWAWLVRDMARTSRHVPGLGDPVPAGASPRVSVIIPARNEEEHIGRCLESLAAQDYPDYEVMAVDDESTDGTGDIISRYAREHPRITHVRVGPKPPGWMGKCWACIEGYRRSDGGLLLFLDADSDVSPDTITGAVRQMGSGGTDVVTLIPSMRTPGFWLSISIPVELCFMHGRSSPTNINDPEKSAANMVGALYMMRRGTYESVGTHEVVRGEAHEDIALARITKKAGYGIRVVRGMSHCRGIGCRGMSDMWDMARRARISSRPKHMIHVIKEVATFLLLLVAPLPALAASLYVGGPGSWALSAASGVSASLMFAAVAVKAHQGTTAGAWHAAFAPLGGMVLILKTIASMTGSTVEWRGRTYQIRGDGGAG